MCDYGNLNNNKIQKHNYDIILRIQNQIDRTKDLYFLYNRKEGFNNETQQFQNKVIITEMEEGSRQSWVQTSLDVGDEYKVDNWNSLGVPLIVQVINITTSNDMDFAHIQIYIDMKDIPSSVPSHSFMPSSSLVPSSLPTSNPRISRYPSISPSFYPSLLPSTSPTHAPSKYPSLSPSTFPIYALSISPSTCEYNGYFLLFELFCAFYVTNVAYFFGCVVVFTTMEPLTLLEWIIKVLVELFRFLTGIIVKAGLCNNNEVQKRD